MAPSTLNADWKTAPTRHVEASGMRFAYRRLGPDVGVPVVLLNHWGANLDNFDPRIVEGLAAERTVYALDYRGIGNSGGSALLSVAEMANDTIATIRALGLTSVDLIGFSLGGFVAQQILLDAPDLVRRAILAGTGPAGGTGSSGSVPCRGRSSSKGCSLFVIPNSISSSRRARQGSVRPRRFSHD